MQSNAAGLGVAGDAEGHPRESAPTIDDSLHSSSDAYALADEEKTSQQQQQQQHQEPEQPSYYHPPAAATNMQRSTSSATAKTTTTTTAPTHSAMMTSSQPANKQQASRRQDSIDERRGPASVPHRQEDYGARHFDIEEEERESGWGLPGPVERPMLRALCLPCAWCLGLCNKGSAYGCLY